MLRLYRAPFSTNVERVALALAFKGLEAESIVISYEDRSPVVEVSGQGLVPVLVDGDEVIHDSKRILQYLEWKYQKSG
jgi:glutathione S-transferase